MTLNLNNMYKLCLTMFCLFLCISSKAQIFKNYHDGSYYTLAGQKVSGLISVLIYKDRIFFKAGKDASAEKIMISDIKAIVISYPGVDSLTVLTEDNKDDNKYFAKFLFATPTTSFYYKFREHNTGGGPTMTIGGAANSSTGSQPAFHNTYTWSNSPGYSGTIKIPMYLDGNSTHELTKKNYIDVLSKAFADVPGLVQKIQNKEFKFKQLDEIFDAYKQERTHSSAK
jgi:hypothetical protein